MRSRGRFWAYACGGVFVVAVVGLAFLAQSRSGQAIPEISAETRPDEDLVPRKTALATRRTDGITITPLIFSDRANLRVVGAESGLPLAVVVNAAPTPVTVQSLFTTQFTDTEGRVRIEGLSGHYRVVVNRVPQFRNVAYEDVELDLAINPDGRYETLVRLARADRRLTITAIDDGGAPIEAISFRLIPIGRTGTTDQRGVVTFADIPRRFVNVEVVGSPLSRRDVCIPSPNARGIDLSEAREHTLTVALPRIERLALRWVLDAQELAAVGSHVALSLLPLACECEGVAIIHGSFRIGTDSELGAPRGRYSVRCEVAADNPYVVRADRDVVEVKGRGDVLMLTCSLETGILQGVVLGPDGGAVPRIPLRVIVAKADGSWDYEAAGRDAKTDDAGRFVVLGLPNRELRVLFYPELCERCNGIAYVGSFSEPHVSIARPSKDNVIRMERGYTITGTIAVGSTTAVDGAVSIDKERFAIESERRLSPENGGRFAFSNLRNGAYRLTYRDVSGATVGTTEVIDVGSEANVDGSVDRAFVLKK